MGATEKTILSGIFSVFAVLVLSSVAYAATCTPNNPDITVSPTRLDSNPGQTAVFNVEVRNNDVGSCSLNQFSMSGSNIGGFGITFSPSSLFIAPGDTETTLMKVSIPSTTATKEYDVSVKASSANYSKTAITTIDVKQAIKQCEFSVNNLRFKEKNSNTFETQFSTDDEITAYIDLSMNNEISGNVTLQLFADGNLVESDTDIYPGNSQTTFKFENKILTKSYNDMINAKVKSTATCNPSETSEDTSTIDIEETEEGVSVDVTIGVVSNINLGDDAEGKVFLKNKGENVTLVNLDAFLCRFGQNCSIEMDCGESIIFLNEDELKELKCRYKPTIVDQYAIEYRITLEGEKDTELSNNFFVKLNTTLPSQPSSGVTTEEGISYTCTGNMRQALLPTESGTRVYDVEFCPNGCLAGACLKEPQFTKKAPAKTSEGGELGSEKVFSEPQFDSSSFNLVAFLEWLKNLLFPKPS